jgi:hypothetical protein
MKIIIALIIGFIIGIRFDSWLDRLPISKDDEDEPKAIA